MDQSPRLGQLLEALTGQRPPLPPALDVLPSFPESGLGYSQLNELLLLLGYDRVTHSFFFSISSRWYAGVQARMSLMS